MVEQTTGNALDAARAARAVARERLEKAAEAIDLARQIEREAQQELAAARRVEETAMSAHATKLERAIVAGTQTMPPSLVIDTRARQAAETRVAIAGKALQTLTEQHAQALTALQAAETAVARAADAILDREAEAIAREIETHHRKLLRLSEKLRGYLPSSAVSIGYAAPPIIAKALELVPRQNFLHVPVDQLRTGAQPADFAAVAAHRAALIAGEATASNDAAVA